MRHRRAGARCADGEGAVEVELHELDGDLAPFAAPPAAPARHAPEPAQPPPRRPRRRWLRYGGLAALAAVVVLNAAEIRRDAARREELAAVPGLLAPMPQAPEQLWRVPGPVWVAGVVDDLLLLSRTDGGFEGLSAVTGQVAWRTPVDQEDTTWGWCRPMPSRPVELVLDPWAQEPPDVAVCERTGWELTEPDRTFAVISEVTVLDARSGALLSTRRLPGVMVSSVRAGDDLLHVVGESTGHLQVVRWDPWTGRERWRHRSADVVFGGGTGSTSVDQASATITVTGTDSVTLSLATGQQAPAPAAGPRRERVARTTLPDGGLLTVRLGHAGARTEVREPGGAQRFTVEGVPALPALRDGETDDVLVVVAADAGRVRGVDVRTGQERWSVPLGVELFTGALLQLDGVVLLSGAEEVQALDLRDGTVRWRADTDVDLSGPPLSDGELVVLPVPSADRSGASDLVAVDLRDGAEQWRVPLPGGAQRLWRAAGVVAVQSNSGVTGLG